MATLIDRTAHRLPRNNLPTILLIVVILIFVVNAVYFFKIKSINRSLQYPAKLIISDDSSPHLIFAKAWYLAEQGDFQTALQLYNKIENDLNEQFVEKVKFNMGTIYLKQAAEYWNSKGVWAYTEVTTLRSFAERALTETVELNNHNWDARFNLEYALRIKPPPKEVEKADWTGRRSSVHAIYPGIPGGGP